MNKSYHLFLTLFCLLLMNFSCNKEVITPNNYSKNMIILGSGGGFTGAVSQYYLLENGLVFRSGNTDTTFTEIGKLEKDIANQLFESYLTLNLDKQHLDEPGNRYYFMIHKAKGQEHKLQWGYKELTNKTPEIFHKNFMSLVKKLEISTVNSSK
ncbi:MAG: hypothetical protein WAT92_21545 [Saprospiraceae bacterium]